MRGQKQENFIHRNHSRYLGSRKVPGVQQHAATWLQQTGCFTNFDWTCLTRCLHHRYYLVMKEAHQKVEYTAHFKALFRILVSGAEESVWA
jgi:hypothetical protein